MHARLRGRLVGAAALLACALLLAGCSAKGGSSSVSRHDPGIHLSPDPAFSTSQVTVVLEDAWMDPARCTFRWQRNGTDIPGATTRALDPGEFHRGDQLAVVVGMPDASGAHRELRAEVGVADSPPSIRHVTLSLNTTSGQPQVQTVVDCVDPDGDPTAFAYRWFKNGALIGGVADSVLPASSFGRGDQVSVEVVARDGETASPPFRSEPLIVDNHPPAFTSQPSAPAANDDAFRYTATASDPDGDALRFELVHGPSGMNVDPQGNVSWNLPQRELRHGSETVTLKVSDGKGGEATQDFTIPLDAAPARPATPPAH